MKLVYISTIIAVEHDGQLTPEELSSTVGAWLAARHKVITYADDDTHEVEIRIVGCESSCIV